MNEFGQSVANVLDKIVSVPARFRAAGSQGREEVRMSGTHAWKISIEICGVKEKAAWAASLTARTFAAVETR
jgi:hypothetical protein